MTTPQTQLGEEVAAATAVVLRRLEESLANRVYSPRVTLLSIEQVQAATGLAPSTLYALVAENKFPKPVKIGRQNKWRESTLIAWLDRQEAAAEA